MAPIDRLIVIGDGIGFASPLADGLFFIRSR